MPHRLAHRKADRSYVQLSPPRPITLFPNEIPQRDALGSQLRKYEVRNKAISCCATVLGYSLDPCLVTR